MPYDFFADSLSSLVLSMSNCYIFLGHCTSQSMAVVWNVTDKGDCPVTQSLGNKILKLHYNTTSLHRIEISTLGISIHHWNRCSVRASHCFPSKLFSRINGTYLSSSHCQGLESLDIAHSSRLAICLRNSLIQNLLHSSPKLKIKQLSLLLGLINKTASYTISLTLISLGLLS